MELFIKKYKKEAVFLLVMCLVYVAGFVLRANASITPLMSNAEVGKCFSVSFDKKQMKTVNRMVVTDGENRFEIRDSDLIDSVVQETMVATHIGTGCLYDKRIDLYCDDTLIRTMDWTSCCDSVRIYDADTTHWIFSTEGFWEEGYIFLSDSLVAELNQIME